MFIALSLYPPLMLLKRLQPLYMFMSTLLLAVKKDSLQRRQLQPIHYYLRKTLGKL
jgi:hypothetical protein